MKRERVVWGSEHVRRGLLERGQTLEQEGYKGGSRGGGSVSESTSGERTSGEEDGGGSDGEEGVTEVVIEVEITYLLVRERDKALSGDEEQNIKWWAGIFVLPL